MSNDPVRVRTSVAAIVAVAILLRVVGLGDRPLHWDEARVGYWTLRYVETGVHEYRPVAGGPLLYLIGGRVLAAFQPSDFVARVPVAILSGLLPAAALTFRDRLRDDETIAVAVVLGFTPLFVHYSRFLRGDVLAAGAALFAVGWLHRWTGDIDVNDGYLYAGVAAWVIAVGFSGFAVATLVLVIAASLVAADHSRIEGTSGGLAAGVAATGQWLVERATPLARAVFVLLGTWIVVFAPRGGGVWSSLGDPIAFTRQTVREPVAAFLGVRVLGRAGTELLPFLSDAIGTAVVTSGPLLVVALAGFLADRYGLIAPAKHRHRRVVLLASAWAGLGVIGYPVVATVSAPWTLVHVLVPASIPAGVGVAAIYRYGRRERDGDRRAARTAIATLLLAAVAIHGAVVLLDDVGTNPSPDDRFGQYGQPADDLEPLVGEMEASLQRAAPRNERIVWVGESYVVSDESVLDRPPIDTETDRDAFRERLPMAWYVERTGAETASVAEPNYLDGEPAVVLAEPAHEGSLSERLPDHESRTVRLGLWNREIVVFLATAES
ncbi:flippase activity-associated protein Agl23 [Halopenitus sp. H-Gu1]|uniref:flippase activity-associated protein Agl23 n=1 Tax=Halopenitus sp. H-Gu1 TaxID=3242697 RepID=UPI00359CF5BE